MKNILVDGMHGLGDNVLQRAVLRRLLATNDDHIIWLRTPWPCLYHDLVGDRLRLINPVQTLRTQRKNAARESIRYDRHRPPPSRRLRVWYDHNSIRRYGSFLVGMLQTTLRCGDADADFSLPVPTSWLDKANALIGRQQKPLMVLRPLVERTEWAGCAARNPDAVAYAALYNVIREQFFVVSIADLAPRQEWLVTQLSADAIFHAGELDVETIAGLMSRAALTFCSPGFAIALSQSVGTPVLSVFGGHESSTFYAIGNRFAPTLGIDPIKPCDCFSRNHACDKRIDLPAAQSKVEDFISEHCHAA